MIKRCISIEEIRVIRKSDQRGLFTIQNMPGTTMQDAIQVIRPMLACLSDDYEVHTIGKVDRIETPTELMNENETT